MKNIEALLRLIQNESERIFGELKQLDPNLKRKAYMVLSNRFGQCSLTSDLLTIMKDFPDALEPNENVTKINILLKDKKSEKDSKTLASIDEAIKGLMYGVSFRQDVMVELRYNPGTLDYILIQQIFECSVISKTFPGSPIAPILFNVNHFLQNVDKIGS